MVLTRLARTETGGDGYVAVTGVGARSACKERARETLSNAQGRQAYPGEVEDNIRRFVHRYFGLSFVSFAQALSYLASSPVI